MTFYVHCPDLVPQPGEWTVTMWPSQAQTVSWSNPAKEVPMMWCDWLRPHRQIEFTRVGDNVTPPFYGCVLKVHSVTATGQGATPQEAFEDAYLTLEREMLR